MRKFLNVYNRSLKKVAILENATDIVETKKINSLYSLSFTLPINDDKIFFCEEFNFVRYGEDGDFYRIISKTFESSDTGTCSIECEHGIGTLMDDFLFSVTEYKNVEILTTTTNLLNKQVKKLWKLGNFFLKGKYSFLWENENILNALYSVAKVSEVPYIWTFNFNTTPWTVNLEKIDLTKPPDYYIRATKNILAINETINNAEICTRLYPLGKGEGVNQLTIKEVNNKIPYIQSPKAITDRYGIISRPYVDRSIESAKTLFSMAKRVLSVMQVPNYERTFNVVDLYPLSNDSLDDAELGKITNLTLDGTKVYITETVRNYDIPGDLSITLSTRSNKLDTIIANIAERNRIETTYSQGSTQIYAQSISENATPDHPAKLSFYIPNDMIYVNSVKAKIELRSFRSFNQVTESGGSSTTTSGGSTTQNVTSEEGGQATVTSVPEEPSTSFMSLTVSETRPSGASNNDTRMALVNGETSMATTYPGTSHKHEYGNWHRHEFDIPDHTHEVQLPIHTHKTYHQHTVLIPKHSHKIPIGNHQHTVTIPSHTHKIKQGIFEHGGASNAEIVLDGNSIMTVGSSSEFDITDKLLDDEGKIPRGRWIRFEVKPDGNSYVHINLFVQGFIQSRGVGTY